MSDIILEIDFQTKQDNPPALHTLTKNYLDLLHKPMPDVDSNKEILFKDDSQIKTLIANFHLNTFGNKKPEIRIRAYRFSHFIKDIELADRIRYDKFEDDSGFSYRYRRYDDFEEEEYIRFNDDYYDDLLELEKDKDWYIEKFGVSFYTLQKQYLQRQRSWCVSTDKDFAAKAADIVGLYLNPPQNAIVLCVDEKPSIQALERRTGYIETRNGKHIRAYKSTYKRNGTLNLFAALQVASGFIKGKITKHKTREDFLEFMDSIVSEYGKEKELHVIMDNYCTHKRNETWLEKNPNVYFHYTPTSASWLNMVEIWFGILSIKSLKGASFHSTDALGQHITCFLENYNKHCNPFKWRKREVNEAQIKNNIENLRN
ncbi:MAG: IS630 family transposase [Bacteroidales bacterium]